jgi:CBS domain-containing protein
MAKKVHQAMTMEPLSVTPATMVRSAAELMERDNVGSLPVVEEDGTLVGIVTDRDIVVRAVAAGRDLDQSSWARSSANTQPSCFRMIRSSTPWS